MKVIKTPKKTQNAKLKLHQLDWLEWMAIGIGFWFLFYPKPYEILLVALLLLPFVGMFLNGMGKPSIASLVEIDRSAKNEYDVADFIDFPAWVIFIRVLRDYELDSYMALLVTGTVAFGCVLLFLFTTHEQIVNSNRDKFWIYSSIIFCFFIYSYSAVTAINCTFDYSEPKVYDTQVIDKHISRSRRSTTYYVKVKPWGHHYDAEDISVSPSEYDHYQINDKVKVDYKEGLLGISWYYLD